MAQSGRAVAALVLTCVAAAGIEAARQQPAVNPQAKILQDFQDRLKAYLQLHEAAAKAGPRLERTTDAARIKAARDALAARIRAARPNAAQGDLFTPEVAAEIRRLMAPEVKGARAAETRKAIQEDQPQAVPLKVNARYPDDQPLPTVPPNVLVNLPRLPEQLEFRVVGTSLILLDVSAGLIVDFIPGAMG